MNLILLGAPGAGKGTQAKAISKNFNIPHISTGGILRNEIKKGSGLGKKAVKFVDSGKLVPDEVIIEMMKKILKSGRSKGGFLIDGFPRNLKQAKMFSNVLNQLRIRLDKVINIVIDKNEVIERLSNRKTCSVCESVFSIDGNTHNAEECPKCKGKLIKRKDDEADIIKHRLEIYEEETKPLTEFYAKEGLLVNINGSGNKKEITERILSSL
jgi:adenylate kinase